MNNKVSYLEIIQKVINRLAQNSFLIKGWTITLVTGLFFLAGKDIKDGLIIILICYFPVISFWILDGYFLWQEKLYRALYDEARNIKNENIDFSLNVKSFIDKEPGWLQCITSKTLLIFYVSILFTILLISVIILSS